MNNNTARNFYLLKFEGMSLKSLLSLDLKFVIV